MYNNSDFHQLTTVLSHGAALLLVAADLTRQIEESSSLTFWICWLGALSPESSTVVQLMF